VIQTILAGGALLACLALLLPVALLEKRRLDRSRGRRERLLFARLCAARKLNAAEVGLLEELRAQRGAQPPGAAPLARGRGVDNDPAVFDRLARRYLEQSPGAEPALAVLRLKMGFGRFQEPLPLRRSAEVPAGQRLVLRSQTAGTRGATVVAHEAQAMVVELDPAEGDTGPAAGRLPRCGTGVSVWLPGPGGMYVFKAGVQRAEGLRVWLGHSERVFRVERRRYQRGPVSLPARVRRAGSAAPGARTHLVELSGGGGTLFNPHLRFRREERLQLHFELPGEGSVDVAARVLRTSSGGSRAHVELQSPAEAIRQSIAAFALSGAGPFDCH
jgi:hypothetical protein